MDGQLVTYVLDWDVISLSSASTALLEASKVFGLGQACPKTQGQGACSQYHWLKVKIIGPCFKGALRHIRIQIGDDNRNRHVAGDDLPGRSRTQQRLLDPAVQRRQVLGRGLAGGLGVPPIATRVLRFHGEPSDEERPPV